MNASTLTRLEALEAIRLSGEGDLWQAAWDAYDLAAKVEWEFPRRPTAEALATVWMALTMAEACERRLAEQSRTTADDNGDWASVRIRAKLDRLAAATLAD
jgi:hypothetical protein